MPEILALRKRQEGQDFKIILNYIRLLESQTQKQKIKQIINKSTTIMQLPSYSIEDTYLTDAK